MFGGVVGATLVPELFKIDQARALTMLIFSFCMQGTAVTRPQLIVRLRFLDWYSQALSVDGTRYDPRSSRSVSTRHTLD